MMALTHFLIVRRDLPFGVCCAQLVHAAGESFFLFGRGSSEKERRVFDAEVAGSSPAPGSTDIHRTTAVVLGARNEARLLKLERKLKELGLPHVAIREPDAPWNGQLMAIGLFPCERELVAKVLRDYQTLTLLPDEDREYLRLLECCTHGRSCSRGYEIARQIAEEK